MSNSPLSVSLVPRRPKCSLPEQVRSGDVFNFELQTDLIPGSTVGYFLTGVVNRVPMRIVIAPVAIDANLVATFNLTSAVTGAWLPGRYEWACFAWDSTGDRIQLGAGEIAILPDVGGANPVDPRTQNRRILDNIRCLIEGRSLDDAVMYKIGGRELTKLSPQELLYFEARYAEKVRRERIRAGQKVRTDTIGIMFGGR